MEGHPAFYSDKQYVSGLSTIMVAVIQETKDKIQETKDKMQETKISIQETDDRISQMEYIFCSQLFPKFQLDTQSFEMKYSEAREAAKDAYKEKEKGLLLQIEKLRNENQTKSSLVLQKEKQLNKYEEKTDKLCRKLEEKESKSNELLLELREKTEEVEKGKELQGNLLKKIETLAAEIMDNEQVFNNKEKENMLLASKVTCLVKRADELQKELGLKTSELDKVRKLQDQLLRQNDSFNLEIVKRGQALEELQEEKKRLLDKQKGLEDRVDKLQQRLSKRTMETSEGLELHKKLLQPVEAKDSEMHSEKRKKRDAIVVRKNLKSRNSCLLEKYHISEETMPHLEGENEVMRCEKMPGPSYDIDKQIRKDSVLISDIMKPVDEQEVLEDKKEAVLVQRTGPALLTKHPSSSKPCPSAGMKRPHSHWRNTRSHQSRVGPDLHDDFLDTPLMNVRDSLGKAMKSVCPDSTRSSVVNMRPDDSDDQTQDIKADAKSNKAGTLGFKYVEPVRKKSDRQNLKGVECKQCKKFYDAVLPGAGETPRRCEHHEGVSRHRYRYAPPSTPEGFWNIGFESEM
ncbi:protein gamma response 1-like [Salvia divinorum]|uniref:Protein gamma response 1-like n=1 Tax=Salvia divinorum TaxID=28513 RepID=A0ABD1FVR7_SALDI